MRGTRHPRGLTLVEVMVAMALVAVAALALVSANTIAARSSSASYRHYVAMRLAQQRLDGLTLGDQKTKLRAAASAGFLPDGTPADCQEHFGSTLAELCDGSQPSLVGWVDIYGRPCRRTGTVDEGHHPTCQYRRYVRFQRVAAAGSQGDLWRIFVAVSHASDGECKDFNEGDSQCVVTSALLTR
ncbi:prepilin-type N-terminal cleavage/methylation domain-containing protein [Vitiosangium sp. GDMCC 1.1324]|uniref:prepilin-type N-terminal cleavage/methylation domain-containing protein n=1 Tax=Vitiosangium sp. (strain GDMCC 1.1324) TaxID=2138576 RepID=UPI000D38C69A|nr:prepilin-type N-terminal cleavage/methylation domain-containing protein [Vitiosangium sp. GDMCC 1.1324]PTL77428.1 hypothetical protein DAT35_44290 [Vitiosangium sp. GDMCC 1.1324]